MSDQPMSPVSPARRERSYLDLSRIVSTAMPTTTSDNDDESFRARFLSGASSSSTTASSSSAFDRDTSFGSLDVGWGLHILDVVTNSMHR